MGAATKAQGKSAMIDNKSMADYRKQFQSERLLHRNATEAEICYRVKEYIKKRIDGVVDEECRKRVMDLTTVALSCASSMVIPFSGVAVVVAATVIQCLNFAVTLGLIPLLNVRSFNDLVAMSKQIGGTIKRTGKSSLMAGVETAVLEILKNLGVGTWLWTEILRDILFEMIGDAAMDAAWIMTPLLAAPKYMMHRHLIKKMYRKLGDNAKTVHATWTEHHCVVQIEVQTTVVTQIAGGVQVDAYGNVQGAFIQTQELAATQTVANNGGAQNGFYQQQAQTQQIWPANQAPCYPPQAQQQMPPPNGGGNFFHPPPAAKPTRTVIMGYTPPANSSFFQPQPATKATATIIMGHTPPANSSFFQPQVGGGFQPQQQAGGYFQSAAVAAQTYTPQANPTYVQRLPAYGTQHAQQMYPPQGQPQGNPYVHMGNPQPQFGASFGQVGGYDKPQAQMVYPPAAVQQVYPPQASAPQPDLWYQAKAN